MLPPPQAATCAFLIAPMAQAAQKGILLLLPLSAPHRYPALRTSAPALRDNLRWGIGAPAPMPVAPGSPAPRRSTPALDAPPLVGARGKGER